MLELEYFASLLSQPVRPSSRTINIILLLAVRSLEVDIDGHHRRTFAPA